MVASLQFGPGQRFARTGAGRPRTPGCGRKRYEFVRLRRESNPAALRSMTGVGRAAEATAPTHPHPSMESATANLKPQTPVARKGGTYRGSRATYAERRTYRSRRANENARTMGTTQQSTSICRSREVKLLPAIRQVSECDRLVRGSLRWLRCWPEATR